MCHFGFAVLVSLSLSRVARRAVAARERVGVQDRRSYQLYRDGRVAAAQLMYAPAKYRSKYSATAVWPVLSEIGTQKTCTPVPTRLLKFYCKILQLKN